MVQRTQYGVEYYPLTYQEQAYYHPPQHYPDEYYTSDYQPYAPSHRSGAVRLLRVLVLAGILVFCSYGTYTFHGWWAANNSQFAVTVTTITEESAIPMVLPTPVRGVISSQFSPEVRYWEPDIVRWAAEYGLDPDMVALVMQIESCGNPHALSRAGAMGMFQVMPYHFQDGENGWDIETNAKRGMIYLRDGLAKANGNHQLAMAGYNGGHGNMVKPYSAWPAEMKKYHNFAGAFNEIKAGQNPAPTLSLIPRGECAKAASYQASNPRP
jgi:soluble lytic murein transglycosylase-like protein